MKIFYIFLSIVVLCAGLQINSVSNAIGTETIQTESPDLVLEIYPQSAFRKNSTNMYSIKLVNQSAIKTQGAITITGDLDKNSKITYIQKVSNLICSGVDTSKVSCTFDKNFVIEGYGYKAFDLQVWVDNDAYGALDSKFCLGDTVEEEEVKTNNCTNNKALITNQEQSLMENLMSSLQKLFEQFVGFLSDNPITKQLMKFLEMLNMMDNFELPNLF
jgi:hypothetical protein